MKRAILISMMVLAAAAGAWGQTLADFQSGFTAFSADMASTLSYNATVGNNWSDAYIGQLVGVPPHFGVGVSSGATTVESDEMVTLLNTLGVDTESFPDLLPVPAAWLKSESGASSSPLTSG